MTLRLETPRLILRSFRDADLDSFVAYRSDPLVARYQNWEAPFPRDEGKKFIDEMKNAQLGIPGTWCQIAIELKATSGMIGDVAVFTQDVQPVQAELGFTLARHYQGQGFATEAVRCVLSYLFGDLKIHRVTAVSDAENHSSYRLMQRLGMRQEAHFIENNWFKNGWSSEYLYALLAREWNDVEDSFEFSVHFSD